MSIFLKTGMAVYSYVTATTEENSYGMTQGKWFDGRLDIATFISRQNSHVFKLTINNINEVYNLDQTCSRDPYYKCLAHRFAKYDFKHVTNLEINGSKCLFHQPCAPFSLPFDENNKVPICKKEIDIACYGRIIQQLDSEQAKFCKKSCHVKEFTFKMDKNGYDELPRGELISKDNKQLVFDLNFDLVPQSTWELRSLMPFKIVKTEYLIMTSLSFVGNVGGTLGMFVWFSFIGLTERFMDSLRQVWKYVAGKT